jgi:cellulose synthase/poly-beta-1,6-N-acetylglucosamine synthase-like glycosyltransferase
MTERPAIEPITVTVEQFRGIANLSKDSIYKLIRAGEIRSVVICGRRLIDLASYRALVARTSPYTSPTRGGLSGGK